MDFIEKMLTQYGFGVTVSLIMLFFFYKILSYVMAQQDKLIEQSQTREKEFFNIMDNHKKAIENQTSQIIEHQKEIKTGFEYNRKEHAEMIITLTRINGFRDEHTK